MARRARLGLLCGLLGAAVLAAARAPSIPQDAAYHRMADGRVVWGIPNASNVVSNFTVQALYGLAKLFETLDARILSMGAVISGHTLEHLAAALSGYWVWRMLMKRQPA